VCLCCVSLCLLLLLLSGEFLSLLGFRLGTSSRIQAGLYLETALVGVSGDMLVTCALSTAA
jgi:hypothetical protein